MSCSSPAISLSTSRWGLGFNVDLCLEEVPLAVPFPLGVFPGLAVASGQIRERLLDLGLGLHDLGLGLLGLLYRSLLVVVGSSQPIDKNLGISAQLLYVELAAGVSIGVTVFKEKVRLIHQIQIELDNLVLQLPSDGGDLLVRVRRPALGRRATRFWATVRESSTDSMRVSAAAIQELT